MLWLILAMAVVAVVFGVLIAHAGSVERQPVEPAVASLQAKQEINRLRQRTKLHMLAAARLAEARELDHGVDQPDEVDEENG